MLRRAKPACALVTLVALAVLAGPVRAALSQAVYELRCDPTTQSATDTTQIVCSVTQGGVAAGGVPVQAEIVASTRSGVATGDEPPDFSVLTDPDGRAAIAYGSPEARTDRLCVWIDQDGDPANINDGDPACTHDADTVVVHVRWKAARPAQSPAPGATGPSSGASPAATPGGSCAVTLNGDPISHHATRDRALAVDRSAALVVAAKSSQAIGAYELLLTQGKFAATPAAGQTGTSFSRSLRVDSYEPGVYSLSVVTREALGCLQTGFVDVGSSSGLAGEALLVLLGLAVVLGGPVAYVALQRGMKRRPKGKHRLTR